MEVDDKFCNMSNLQIWKILTYVTLIIVELGKFQNTNKLIYLTFTNQKIMKPTWLESL